MLNEVKGALISYCIISYNQENYVKNAVDASFLQSFDDMEVIISDDCSSDHTLDVIKKNIKSSAKIPFKVNCNSVNQGINAHVNTVSELCTGQFVVIASGDDISMPNRVERLAEEWKAGAVGVFSNAEIINTQGDVKGLFMYQGYRHLETWKEMVMEGRHGAWGCSFAWDQKIFDVFGSLPLNLLGEDAVIPFRCALLGRISYIDEPLVQYRDHGNNVSFWAQIKKTSGQSLMTIGEKIILFDQTMYQNWRKDVATAASAGYLTKEDVMWAETWLSIHEEIRCVQLELLQCSYIASMIKLVCELWYRRISEQRNLWAKRIVGTFLQFRMPHLYNILLYIKGISRV